MIRRGECRDQTNQISSPLRFSLFQIKKEICNKKNEIFLFEIETFLIVSNEACIKRFLNAPTRHFGCFLPSKICTYFFFIRVDSFAAVCAGPRGVCFSPPYKSPIVTTHAASLEETRREKNLIFFQQCHQITVEKRKETNSLIQVLIDLLLDFESPRYAIVWPDTPNPFSVCTFFYSPLLDCVSFLRLRCTIYLLCHLKSGRRHIPSRNQKECAQGAQHSNALSQK